MKRLIIALAVTFTSFTGIAQTTSAKVTYKETIKLDIELEGDMAQFAAMLPKEQSFEKELHFTPEASVYKSAPKKDEAPSQGGMIRQIMIDGAGGEEIVFRDLKENKMVSQKEFMSRKFLVSGDARKSNWKMTGKQKTVLGYACQEAVMEADSQKIIAWFAPAIPVGTGPREFGGLPGLILEANIGEMFAIAATEVKVGAADKKLLVKPTEGKKMTNKQFEDMMLEKTKEMQEERGGASGGNRNVQIKVISR
jgi:GLPGLI family protein